MRMKGLAVFLALLAISPLVAAESSADLFTNSISGFNELASGWQALTVLSIIISVILIAIAYMVGTGFEIAQVKAWANTELVQVFVNVLIIMSLMVTITFIDTIAASMVQESGLNIACTAGKSCLQQLTHAYLDDYVSAANSGAKDVLRASVEAAATANRRIGGTCISIICLQIGYSQTVAGQFVLQQDMNNILFEYYSNLLSSLESQLFFVDHIAFGMGPVILAIGIVARAFFFTRKLGGLLIAIAVGVMFFFPGMYIFDWVTLDMALNGDRLLSPEDNQCPPECMSMPPVAVVDNGDGSFTTLESVGAVYHSFDMSDESEMQKAKSIVDGTQAAQTNSSGATIHSCNNPIDSKRCPMPCRVLPYPTLSLCANQSVQEDCAQVQRECKTVHIASSPPAEGLPTCPASCKVVPPLKSDCSADSCLASRMDCRVYQRTGAVGSDLAFTPSQDALNADPACGAAANCHPNEDADESCSYIIPAKGRCDELCAGCPPECRIDTIAIGPGLPDYMPENCKEPDTMTACEQCTDSCLVKYSDLESLDTQAQSQGKCATCPIHQRLLHPSLPENYTANDDANGNDCAFESCPVSLRAEVPVSACDMCVFSDESQVYNPPLNTRCSESCSGSTNVPLPNSGTYTNIGAEGLVGVASIQNLAKLFLPGYILPLFNIVATLVFIKGFSTILGGDIEIPGLSRVF